MTETCLRALISTTFWDTFVITTYNKYKNEGFLPEKPNISDVLDIVRMDVAVSSLLYGYMRQSEQALRAAWVKAFCSKHQPSDYLNPQVYLALDEYRTGELFTKDMMRHILRYREPYVRKKLENLWEGRGKPSEILEDWGDINGLRHKIANALPLWSVVDSFSLGVLSYAVTQSYILDGSGEAKKQMLYKETALQMGVSHKHFDTRLRSLTTLRNRVAHGSRLWMVPTTDTPARPAIFAKDLREADRKGMLVSFANVALLQGNARRQREAWDAIKALVEQNQSYCVGVGSQKIFEKQR